MDLFKGRAPHTALPPEDSLATRLIKVLPGTFDDPIRCELEPTSLGTKPHYVALSYAWGDPTDTELISLDGCVYPVTKNLAWFLRHMQSDVITFFIFYPASWLSRIGLGYGTEASLNYSVENGWKFNFIPVRAVPESSLTLDLCRRGETQAVELMLARSDASVKDTSPKGWSPLHVSPCPQSFYIFAFPFDT
jgi:hypothetical protein